MGVKNTSQIIVGKLVNPETHDYAVSADVVSIDVKILRPDETTETFTPIVTDCVYDNMKQSPLYTKDKIGYNFRLNIPAVYFDLTGSYTITVKVALTNGTVIGERFYCLLF